MPKTRIPTISIAHLEQPETLRALDTACREWGIFQILEHGIDAAVGQRLQRQMRDFFALPDAQKLAVSRSSVNPWGYYDQELTKNTPDWKQIYDYGPSDPRTRDIAPQWPEPLPDFQPAILAFYAACETLAFKLLTGISRNLGMPGDDLRGHFAAEHSSFLRLNYFPPCPTPAQPQQLNIPTNGHLGVNHHTDSGALTILLHDEQPGLEVYRDDAWHLIRPVPGALVVNIGDIVQVWSNDRYRAPLHRVRANASAERFSAPFFFNPAYATNYAPLPTTVDKTHPARYRSINWGEFRRGRAAGDYTDQGEEIQISQFRC